ncbi:MAG: peptidase M19, partial [Anaerolineae bacterium]
MPMPLLVDAHEDLAWNIQVFERDYTRSAEETRRLERGSLAVERNGDTLLGWPAYPRGRVAVVFSTLFAAPARRRVGEWDTQAYANFDEAHRLYHGQLTAYHRLAEHHPEKFRLIGSRADLEDLLARWEDPHAESDGRPVGLVPLMEGAEGVRSPDELGEWWEEGLRIIGLAWAGTRFCGGTREPGPLTEEGRALLNAMAEVGFALDLSHMDEAAALEALDLYPGTVIASHANPAALLPGVESNRHLSDRLIRGIIERDGVIGIVPFNAFLVPDWRKGDSRQKVTLERVVAHIDYICQMAGDARHVGIGSDFDGGFGVQSVPADVDTIADLQKLAPLLAAKGYSDEDIARILGENWLAR